MSDKEGQIFTLKFSLFMVCELAGINSVIAKEEVDKMNAISSSRRLELMDSARRSFCYRHAIYAKMPFGQAVALCPKYQTSPEIVSAV